MSHGTQTSGQTHPAQQAVNQGRDDGGPATSSRAAEGGRSDAADCEVGSVNSIALSTSEGPGESKFHPAIKVSPGPSRTLYHGGAPGFRPGDIIEPHPTRHVDGCQWCASGADDNHLPDRVFATPVRLYGKFYASKYFDGWLYLVEPIGEWELSDGDPIEAHHAAAVRVVSVSERCVRLTPAERRRLWRIWKEADDAAGRHTDYLTDLRTKRAMGIYP